MSGRVKGYKTRGGIACGQRCVEVVRRITAHPPRAILSLGPELLPTLPEHLCGIL